MHGTVAGCDRMVVAAVRVRARLYVCVGRMIVWSGGEVITEASENKRCLSLLIEGDAKPPGLKDDHAVGGMACLLEGTHANATEAK